MGDWGRAEPDLRKAMELAPDQAVVLNYLGYALLDRNLNLDEEQRLIEKASALRPRDGAITDSPAWVYFQRGDFLRAIALLEQEEIGRESCRARVCQVGKIPGGR